MFFPFRGVNKKHFSQCFFFVFFCTVDFCDFFKNNYNLKIYIFCPLQAENSFKALITVAISRTYWNYFLKNILFARRRRKNFEVLTAALLSGKSLKLFFESTLFSARHRRKFWGSNKGPVSGISLKLFFFQNMLFSARRRRKNFWGSFNLCKEKSLQRKTIFRQIFSKIK